MKIKLPLFLSTISAGFPSPADDYIDKRIDLNKSLIKHPAATFFVRAKGESMTNSGISNNDLLIVDRSIEAYNNSIIVAILNGSFTVKRFKKKGNNVYLLPDNKKYKQIRVTEDMDFQVWGVVKFAIKNIS